MTYARIVEAHGYLPRNKLSNDDIATMVDTSDEWIQKRTGIITRFIADPQETTLDMAVKACLPFKDQQIDMILVACYSQENRMPSLASRLQHALGFAHTPVLDLNAACTGFIYALSIANAMIKSEQYQKILVVGVDKNSNHVDWTDRNTCCLFGDGAGAVLVAADSVPGIMHCSLGSDPEYADDLKIEKNSMGDEYITMDGKKIFKLAVNQGKQLVNHAIHQSNVKPDYVIFHQANKRIIDAIVNETDLNSEAVSYAVAQHANTSAASIPLALSEAIEKGYTQAGDHILMVAFGAGFSWGSTLLRL